MMNWRAERCPARAPSARPGRGGQRRASGVAERARCRGPARSRRRADMRTQTCAHMHCMRVALRSLESRSFSMGPGRTLLAARAAMIAAVSPC
eukprot:scaffold663_cov358-Prasinococcus_capsulatus_cf.AAC.7